MPFPEMRPTMVPLVAVLHRMVGDRRPPYYFEDTEVQDALDRTRVEARYQILSPKPQYSSATLVYLDYYSSDQWWEDDWALFDSTFNPVLIPIDYSEPLVGHWKFQLPGQLPSVRLTGKSYDPFQAAVDLLSVKLADEDLGFDFKTESGASYSVGQLRDGIQHLIETYKQQARPRVGMIYNSDDMPDDATWPVGQSLLPGDFYNH